MTPIKSVFWFVLLQLFIFAALATSKPFEVELLTDRNYAPYSYVKDNKVMGIYPDIIRAAFALMPDYQLKLTAVDWPVGKEKIQKGEALALIGVYFHGHDWPYMYPYSLAFWQETVVTVCKSAILTTPRNAWPQDYQGLVIGHVEGYDGWLDDDVRNEQNMQYVNFFEVPTTSVALEMVKRGSLDCTLFETFAYEYAVFKQANSVITKHKTTDVEIATTLSTNPVYIGYSRKALKQNTFAYALDFQQALDVAIFKLKRTGKLDELSQKYFTGN